MSSREKLIERFKRRPSDFTFNELQRVLGYYGFTMTNRGATSGSRVGFQKGDRSIRMHKPHPGNIIGQKTLKYILEYLNEDENGVSEI